MQLEKLLLEIDKYFPFDTAVNGDRIGLQIQTEEQVVNGILFTLEITDNVIEECIFNNFNTIVSFHPLIYSKLANISLNERVGRLCSKLIKKSINLISIHTTFDAYEYGTSKILSDLLELDYRTFLVPDKIKSNCGMGVISVPTNKITTLELVSKVSEVCYSPVRYCGNDDLELKKIAIVGGSGTSFIPDVIANHCDCFITADATYHQFHSAKDNFTLIDVGHYEMEQFVPNGIAKALNDFLMANKISFIVSNVLTNPINYYPKNNFLNKQKNYLNNK
jgi:dinuclear metal center YbgI/SA1388 family protein